MRGLLYIRFVLDIFHLKDLHQLSEILFFSILQYRLCTRINIETLAFRNMRR